MAPRVEPAAVASQPAEDDSFWNHWGASRIGSMMGSNLDRLQTVLYRGWKLGWPGGPSEADPEVERSDASEPLKIRVIHYLDGLEDSDSSRVIDQLLASLDDPAETVRFEALKAIENRWNDRRQSTTDQATDWKPRAASRIEQLLLEPGPTGELREQSPRVRQLAMSLLLAGKRPSRSVGPPANQPPADPAPDQVPALSAARAERAPILPVLRPLSRALARSQEEIATGKKAR